MDLGASRINQLQGTLTSSHSPIGRANHPRTASLQTIPFGVPWRPQISQKLSPQDPVEYFPKRGTAWRRDLVRGHSAFGIYDYWGMSNFQPETWLQGSFGKSGRLRFLWTEFGNPDNSVGGVQRRASLHSSEDLWVGCVGKGNLQQNPSLHVCSGEMSQHLFGSLVILK